MGLLGLWLAAALYLWLYARLSRTAPRRYGCRQPTLDKRITRFARKPPWVLNEVLRLAVLTNAGGRTVAAVFNRHFAHRDVAVGKTYVSDKIREHQYQLQNLRRDLKHKPPRCVPRQLVWGVDLTGKQDAAGNTHSLLGIVEHHARACLDLRALADRTSTTLLRCLLDVIERFGKPRIVRTDNEAVFTSLLFRFGLWLLGIRHQTTDLHCPWQNGRIERFFGTLKSKLDRWQVESLEQLTAALVPFRFWYNHVRPHQNLQGRTPAEVWAGQNVLQRRSRQYCGMGC